MTTINSNSSNKYNPCACKDCPNVGIRMLEIEYIKKRGLFCGTCASDLLFHGIGKEVEKHSTIRSAT